MSFTDIFGSNKPRCQHFSEDGSRCQGDPQKDKKFCFMHDPGQKEKQAEARKKGGLARFQPYEPKIPSGFEFKPLMNRAQVRDFINELGLHVSRGDMDQRSSRHFAYLANIQLAILNAEDRERNRAARSADQEYRRKARESDPWSPFYHASERAKAREEAEKTEAQSPAEPEENKDRVQQSLVTDAAAQSMRELEQLKKEEEKKEQEHERSRNKNGKSGYPCDWNKTDGDETDPIAQDEVVQCEAVPERPAPPKKIVDYIMYGNSPFPPFDVADTNRQAVLTQYMQILHQGPELKRKRPTGGSVPSARRRRR